VRRRWNGTRTTAGRAGIRATVELHDCNLDHACQLASDAAYQLHQGGYATGAGRLRDFRAAIEPWSTTPVRVLGEQLAALN